MKTLIGIITFGNLPFTQLTVNEIRRTVQSDYELFVVVGKPDDEETADWVLAQRIPHVVHHRNWGMPASLNDIYDAAFVTPNAGVVITQGRTWLLPKPAMGESPWGKFDNVIFVGNDVIVYPGAVDAMIAEARRGEFDWICASQYDVQSLCRDYEAARPFFSGATFHFTDFNARPWDLHADKVPVYENPVTGVEANCRKDVRNLCLFTRKSFDILGYADVNFWPGGYFEDNDYGRRGDLAQVKACGLKHAAYFHFWSRTIHQGQGTTATWFGCNSDWYRAKWGGPVGGERFELPWGDNRHALAIPQKQLDITYPDTLRIHSRQAETDMVLHQMERTA